MKNEKDKRQIKKEITSQATEFIFRNEFTEYFTYYEKQESK